MPLTNADNPFSEQPAAERPTKTSKAKAAKEETPAAPKLVKASTSGAADVHNLLAEREIALSNQDADHIAAIDAKLAALGFVA